VNRELTSSFEPAWNENGWLESHTEEIPLREIGNGGKIILKTILQNVSGQYGLDSCSLI
jgi:hypothetical protein